MMASNSSEECVCVKLFAEELLKCLLSDSGISWNPRWGFQIETSVSIDGVSREVLPDLNACRGLISESVSVASRRFRSLVRKEVSYICKHACHKDLLLPNLIFAAESYQCFFTFIAIAKYICIRFLREEKPYLIAQVLEAVVYFMEDMTVYHPELFRREALDFVTRYRRIEPMTAEP